MFVLHLTEEERRFVLNAVRCSAGRFDPFGQSLVERLSKPDPPVIPQVALPSDAADAAGMDAYCEDMGEF